MNKIPNQALKTLMDTKLSNLALVCLTYLLRNADNHDLRVELADMRRELGYADNHGTYYSQIRKAMTELNGTFIQYREEVSPVAASTAAKEGRNVVFTVTLNPIFFELRKNEKTKFATSHRSQTLTTCQNYEPNTICDLFYWPCAGKAAKSYCQCLCPTSSSGLICHCIGSRVSS
jgi:hypothetical protein